MSQKLVSQLCLLAMFVMANLTAKAQPVAHFSALPVSGCAPLIVSFHDESTGNPTHWKWNLGNATISYLQHPVATYFNPGTYNVKLVVQNATGSDSLIINQYITVYASPGVFFSASDVNGCAPFDVAFQHSSTAGSGSISSLLWDFGDGNFSNVANPSHTYSNPGSYNVSLRVNNSLGCTKTVTETNYITVAPLVHAAFTHSAPAGCTAPETIVFTNQSTGTGTITYAWNFGDGGTSALSNPGHTYNTPGIYTVQLICTSAAGCTDTFSISNLNIASVDADFVVPQPLCAGSAPALFSNSSAPAPDSVRWTFGDGSSSTQLNPMKAFAIAGTYTVKLVSYFGACRDSVSKPVTVSAKPVSNFTGSPLSSCTAPLIVNFNANSNDAIAYSWNFGDGGSASEVNPSHTYTSPGAYTVTLITTNAAGCSDTLVRTNYINIVLPQASINQMPQQGCAPFAWTFSSTVTSLDPVVSYEWNFGDGTTSAQANPTHVFGEGLYDIQLVVTTAGGCRDTVRRIGGIRASRKPQAAFTANPRELCAFHTVNFTNQSTGTISQYLWLFGDGGNSTQQNPSHMYQDTGYFTVTLIVGNYGCFDTLVMPNYIHVNPPIARFDVVKDCDSAFLRRFNDLSIGADSWEWNFGDGNTSTQQHPVHTYASVGNFTVTLVVRNSQTGCMHSTTQPVVIANEQAMFTTSVTELCKRSAVQFTAQLNNAGGIISYNWSYGDGAVGIGSTVSHTYNQAGNFTVRLIITDAAGCRDTLLRPGFIRVNGPAANFTSTVPGTCLLTPVTFNNTTTTDAVHPITQFKWNYGDGNIETLTAPPFTHSYSNAGAYHVTLTVTDAFGCIDSIRKNNIVTISRPVAAFNTPDTVSCPGANVHFVNASTGPGLSYTWDFGDGSTATTASPVHSYSANGHYSIGLRIRDQYGCTDEVVKTMYVRILTPVAQFSLSDTFASCPPLIVQFTNGSANQSSYQWDFGDGTFSTEVSPSHFYNVAGVYFPKLRITGPGGCSSAFVKRVEVRGPSGSFVYPHFTGCEPLTVNFIASTQSRSSFVWDFNDGTTIISNDSIVNHTYTVPGIYVPKMILRDTMGCAVPILGPDTIVVSGVTAGFAADRILLCSNGTVQFTNNTVSNDIITGYAWDFADGNTSTQASPAHFYSAEGLYHVRLKAFTAMGCTDSAESVLPVKVVRTPVISVTQNADGCVPLTKNFNGNLLNADTSAITWQWQLSNGINASTQHLSALQITSAGNYTAQLVAINSSGCKDTATAAFEAFGIPVISAGADITICEGTAQPLHASGGATYVWSPSVGLSCSNCASPGANPASITTYTVTGTSVHGCSSRDSITVAVKYPFVMQKGRGDTICAGESLALIVGGAATYSWSPSAGLNNTSSAVVKATPAATTTYMAVGTDDLGCFRDTAYFPVKVYPIPQVEAGADVSMNVGQTITLTPAISADVTEVYWSPTGSIFRSQFPYIDIRPKQTTQYRVQAVNPGGCSSTDMLTVNVLCNGANVFIPNTFSPNGDAVNEVFYPRGTGLFTIKSAKIFNRWGQQVFASYNMKPNDAFGGWNGTFQGKPLGSDVFVYLFEIVCDNNEILVYKGDVALIR